MTTSKVPAADQTLAILAHLAGQRVMVRSGSGLLFDLTHLASET
jgi:hypothetical protein